MARLVYQAVQEQNGFRDFITLMTHTQTAAIQACRNLLVSSAPGQLFFFFLVKMTSNAINVIPRSACGNRLPGLERDEKVAFFLVTFENFNPA